MAHVFQSLMLQLNYPKYVVQGGDWGGIVLRYIAADFPDSVPSVLSNFWVIQPNATDFARYEAGTSTPDETVAIQGFNSFFKGLGGYFYEQQLHPLQIAHLLTDSPVGNAMWIYDLMYHAVENFWWTPKEIITWSMMYWIQGPYAGARIYRESLLVSLLHELQKEMTDFSQEGSTVVGGFATNFPYINQPIAISEFPADIQYRVVSILNKLGEL
jgi:pimeloyl-ACP methyl ester carboxylesterase